jgi:voltage-gated potassium channel
MIESPKTIERKSRISLGLSLAIRAALVLGLIGIALIGHWLDRDGLRDNVDGHVSFVDIIYFTTVTVTTAGYGDIVPVTQSARLFDTLVLTPIRLFIWLIFLGTAYTFVLKRTWEQMRTKMIKRTLSDHYVVCGFGTGGASATEELIRQGIDPSSILIVDADPTRVAAAIELGVNAVQGDATHNDTLRAAVVERATAVLVSTGRDDTAALVVLSVRQLNPSVPVSASVSAVENEDLLRQAGAISVINPVDLGGHLLARSATNRHAVDYLHDLASAQGRVEICERAPAPQEFGSPLRSIRTGLGLRVIREGRPIGYWELAAEKIQSDDIIVEIVTVKKAEASS